MHTCSAKFAIFFITNAYVQHTITINTPNDTIMYLEICKVSARTCIINFSFKNIYS